MSRARRQLGLAGAIVKRDLRIALSYRLQFLAGVFSGFFSLATFYYISRLVQVPEFSPSEYFAFVAIGVVIFSLLMATLTTPQVTLRQELVAGTFERLLVAPGGSIASILSLLIFPAVYAVFTSCTLVCIGVTLFGLELQWSTVPLSIPVAALGIFAFAPFGVLLLASIIAIKRAPPGASYLIIGFSLISGLYFPVDLLPGWIQWASEVQPFTPAVELFRATLVGQSLSDPAWVPVAKLVAFAAVALPLSVVGLRAALRASRRRGTILEY
jgi:ABC-2 type transport system permease protein